MANMLWLRKLPGYRRSPAGFEWRLLRLMPTVWLAGTLMPAVVALPPCYLLTPGGGADQARHIQLFDYMMIGLAIFVWTLVLTVTIGCIIVWLMKGPAYVADGFEVSHSDQPQR